MQFIKKINFCYFSFIATLYLNFVYYLLRHNISYVDQLFKNYLVDEGEHNVMTKLCM